MSVFTALALLFALFVVFMCLCECSKGVCVIVRCGGNEVSAVAARVGGGVLANSSCN